MDDPRSITARAAPSSSVRLPLTTSASPIQSLRPVSWGAPSGDWKRVPMCLPRGDVNEHVLASALADYGRNARDEHRASGTHLGGHAARTEGGAGASRHGGHVAVDLLDTVDKVRGGISLWV